VVAGLVHFGKAREDASEKPVHKAGDISGEQRGLLWEYWCERAGAIF
jgi:hypothetical protein